jgi:hypothetical protein
MIRSVVVSMRSLDEIDCRNNSELKLKFPIADEANLQESRGEAPEFSEE